MSVVRTVRLLALATALTAAVAPARAQGYFGTNQVEYHKFNWLVIETEHFTIHYYPEEATVAMDVARMSERAYARLSRVFQWEFRDKKPIMLFASRADFGENLVTGDLGEGTGGVTEPIRHRMLFFFTGSYRSTEHVLTHEMVHEFQFDIFGKGKAGGGLQALQAVNPPLWFMEGMAEYLSKGPNDPFTNVIIRVAALNNDVPSMAQMTNEPDQYFPYRYGESFFAYVGRRWGDESIGQIMLETPSLGVERAFERNTGRTLTQVAQEWKTAVQEQFLPQAAKLHRARTVAELVLNKHRTGGDVFVDPAISPDGKYIVFLSNGNFNKGEVFVDLWLADAHTGKRIKRLVKSTVDPHYEEIGLLYSQAAFSPDGKKLAFSALSGGQEVLYVLDVARRKRIGEMRLPLDGITGPSWSPDGSKIAFSGTKGGISDIYTVDADGTNLTALTHDKYGDVMPSWSPDGTTIAFSTERGPGSDLAELVFPKLRIALFHLDTKQIELLPNQAGLNLNPMWSPDGKSIAYVSNRAGSPDLYMYDVASRTHYQITSMVGGVMGITDVSPTISWAHAADRIAFSYYEDGLYTIWTLDSPEKLERAPVPEGGALAAAPAPAPTADTTKLGAAPNLARSYYNGPAGFRPSAVITADTSGAERPISVAAILDTGAVKLPDTSMFLKYPYKLALAPEIAASPTIGYSHDNFGSGFYGGTAIALNDMTGGTRMAFQFAINGRLEDFVLNAAYGYFADRFQYIVGFSNIPFYYSQGTVIDTSGGGLVETQVTTRYLQRSVYGIGIYPLDRFRRFEVGLRFTDLNRENVLFTYDLLTGAAGRFVGASNTKNYVTPSVAYVFDNTLFGWFAPITGTRYRFQVAPSIGGFNWIQSYLDYRHYEPLIFNKLILAFHAYGIWTTGPDADSLRQYIAYPDAVRGYDGSQFGISQQCYNANPNNPDRCNPAIGSSAAYGSFEIRAPIYRGGGSVVPIPPIELFAFWDAGITWFTGQTVIFARQANLDPTTQRGLLTSNGFGARVDLFGAAILSWAFVKPYDLYTRGRYVQFSFYLPF